MRPSQSIEYLENSLENTLFIRGEVSFHSVTGLMQTLDQLVLKDSFKLDCSGMTHIDSVAVSLLLYLLKERRIELQGVSTSLQGLLNLYGVAGFFEANFF